jgi:hypothetical protein
MTLLKMPKIFRRAPELMESLNSETMRESMARVMNDPDAPLEIGSDGKIKLQNPKGTNINGLFAVMGVMIVAIALEHNLVKSADRFNNESIGANKPTSAQLASNNRVHIETDTVRLSAAENLTPEVRKQIQEIYNRATHTTDFAGEVRIEGHTNSYNTEKSIGREFAKLYKEDANHSDKMNVAASLHYPAGNAHYVVIKHFHYNL